jgi:hypothetical protein
VIDGLTRRALPEHDASIDELSEDDRRFAARQWLGRARAELESVRAFRWIAEACAEIGAPAEMIALAERAASDEERHGEICRRVATRYQGSEAVPVLSPPRTVELRTPDDVELAVTLYIVESCCLSETIGAVTIESALRVTTAPLAAAALRELLADEVHHARMGWAYLGAPDLGGRHKTALAGWLPALLDSMFDYWAALVGRRTPAAVLGHGCVPLEQIEEWILVAFDEVALPGFAHVGIDTRAAHDHFATRRDRIFHLR